MDVQGYGNTLNSYKLSVFKWLSSYLFKLYFATWLNKLFCSVSLLFLVQLIIVSTLVCAYKIICRHMFHACLLHGCFFNFF